MEIGRKGITGLTALFFMMLSLPLSSASSYDVIVVRGDVPTDYTIASIYASTQKIPLVLVDPDNIESPIMQELSGYNNKGYSNLLIIGGQNAISASVEDKLSGMGFSVNRLWDWNRYGTAARVAIDLWGKSEDVIITNGEDYTGFLISQFIALERGAPILLAMNDTLPGETEDAVKKLGSTSAILVNCGRDLPPVLREMGLSIETIETVVVENGETKKSTEGMDIYYISSAAVIAALAVIVIYLKAGRKKSSVFLLTEDEEKIVEILKIHGKTEQSRIAGLTGFSKPRVSRLLRALNERGITEREKFKKTYKIKLKPKIA